MKLLITEMPVPYKLQKSFFMKTKMNSSVYAVLAFLSVSQKGFFLLTDEFSFHHHQASSYGCKGGT